MAYLTDEERKAPLTKVFNGCVFDTCMDLSCGIKVYPQTETVKWDLTVQAKILFTAWWCTTIYKQLNVFPGFDTVQWIDLDANPNFPEECRNGCIHKKYIQNGGPCGHYLAKCLYDGTHKNHWNNRCFCPTQYKSKWDENETK